MSAWHYGRSFEGHWMEDDCPCPQEPCGLVSKPVEECDQHPLGRFKTIRQSHPAERCPARFDGAIESFVRSVLENEYAQIEADLLAIPGVHREMTQAEALELGLEVCFQRSREPFRSEYRGIRRRGEWVVDHHPEWGPVRG
ncbi:hypothetical protein [Leifsonia aquatica]|uniref:hypothetical protein n=1 Tax=Leifsonia aquatica TaxID=144185 RepID=UPI0005B97C37|nr:hypothetical protein [Leifsonia aquatica]